MTYIQLLCAQSTFKLIVSLKHNLQTSMLNVSLWNILRHIEALSSTVRRKTLCHCYLAVSLGGLIREQNDNCYWNTVWHPVDPKIERVHGDSLFNTHSIHWSSDWRLRHSPSTYLVLSAYIRSLKNSKFGQWIPWDVPVFFAWLILVKTVI